MSRIHNLSQVKNMKASLLVFACCLLFVYVLRTCIFAVTSIPSESMCDTMQVGDKLFAINTYFLDDLHRGDIIVFEPNEEEKDKGQGLWTKRVVGLPGDKIRIENGIVYVNGTKQKEEYVKHPASYTGSFTVPNGKYFCCGDNRANSWDARFWSNPFLTRDQIKYKMLFRILPFNRMGNIYKEKSIAVE